MPLAPAVRRLLLTLVAAAAVTGAAPAGAQDLPAKLAPADYAAIDSAAAPTVLLDNTRLTPAGRRKLQSACALGSTTGLVRLYRRACLTTVGGVAKTEAFGRCRTFAGCESAARALWMTFDSLIDVYSDSNADSVRALADGPCRAFFRTSAADLRVARSVVGVLKDIERAYDRGRLTSRERASILTRYAKARRALAASNPSNASQLALFRRSCR